MKFGVAWIALAAAVASADDVSVNSNQPQILNLMSRDLVAAMSYLPASVIGALMLGNGPLPTDAAALLDLASGMPDEERQSVSSLYDDFIAKAGTMLPTASATSESSSSPTATDESTDEESDLSEDSSGSESSGDDESSGSSEDEDESSDKSDDDDNDKSSDKDSDLDSDTSGTGAVHSFGAAAVAAIAVAALF
ncbi:hypothetical protein IWW50_006090 [Coemansia erecta]|nr:hypothetical protein IWW50_006090 [Coemansia erecta]